MNRREMIFRGLFLSIFFWLWSACGLASRGKKNSNQSPWPEPEPEPGTGLTISAHKTTVQEGSKRASRWVFRNRGITLRSHVKSTLWYFACALAAKGDVAGAVMIWREAFSEESLNNALNPTITATVAMHTASFCGVRLSKSERSNLERLAKDENPVNLMDNHLLAATGSGAYRYLAPHLKANGLAEKSGQSPTRENLLTVIIVNAMSTERQWEKADRWVQAQERTTPFAGHEVPLALIALTLHRKSDLPLAGISLARKVLARQGYTGAVSENSVEASCLSTAQTALALALYEQQLP